MREELPKQDSLKEVYRTHEVPLPEDMRARGYSGTYYFQVSKDEAGIHKINLIIKQTTGILGAMGSDYKGESFIEGNQAVRRAEELAASPSDIHWSEKI